MQKISTTTPSLGQHLYFLRKYKCLSLQELSEITGISRSNLNRYEHDASKPTTEYLKVLCQVYQVSSDYLLLGVQTGELQKEGWDNFDPELKKMVTRLVSVMSSKDPHLRSWAIVQFKHAFEMK